jgi:hypothetical protein
MASLSLAVTPHTRAATIWSDNFNDFDYAGWSALLGSFTAADGTLRCTSAELSAIQRASTVHAGTWSFDFAYVGSIHLSIVFFAVEEVGDFWGNQGYHLNFNGIGITLQRTTDWINTVLDTYTAPAGLQGRQHIDVTRDATGLFRVYVNNTLEMEATDTLHNTANFFLIHMFEDEYIDNIEVSDTVDITPTDATGTTDPTDTPAAIPGFPLGAILLVLIPSILLVTLVRRGRRSRRTD